MTTAIEKGLEATVRDLRAKKRETEQERDIWKKMALSPVRVSEEAGSRVVSLILEYPDNQELSYVGRLMSSIAWGNYPNTSFERLLIPSVARIIDEYGINFRVIGKKDTCCASGHKPEAEIFIDHEEWDKDIPVSLRVWRESEFVKDEIDEAIEDFCGALVIEIKDWMEQELELDIEELYKLLG